MNEQELKVLTHDTFKEIRKLDIVPPCVYKDIFFANAKNKHIDVDDMDLKDASGLILDKINKISEQTEINTNKLKDSVDEAIIAIENRDENMLLEINKKVSNLQEEVTLLKDQLYKDELTKIYNRKWMFENYLEDDEFISDGTIAFIDVNSFKHINDTYGHITGDQVLVLIASLLSRIENANAVRYAGDEFVIISNSSDVKYLTMELEKRNNYLNKKKLKTGGKFFKVNFSFGVAKFKKNNSYKDIIEIVDEKMYKYKKMIKAKKNE